MEMKKDFKKGLLYCARFESNDICNGEPIQLLDLRIKQYEDFLSDEGRKLYLNLFPLILACSVIVKETDKPFKPEYIIPQLTLEWIRSNALSKINEKIRGIAYSSTKITTDDVDLPSKLFNVVMPAVIPSQDNTSCDRLRNILRMTVPEKFSISNENTYCARLKAIIRMTVPEKFSIHNSGTGVCINVNDPNKPHENIILKKEGQLFINSQYGQMEQVIDKKSLKKIE
jgi:hypothetical protein